MLTTPKIKILQYTLYDLKTGREELIKFMSRTFKLIETNTGEFNTISEPLALFHNKTHNYSGIQFGIEEGALSIRAYGGQEIKALKTWLKLYKKHHAYKPRNMQTIEERYSLEFLPGLQQYRLSRFLVNRAKQKQLSEAKNAEEVKKILADYVVANFLPFFNHLNYRHNRQLHEITVNLLHYKRRQKLYTVFKGAKRQAFDLVFETNLSLPRLFRMGEATAMGFGNVTREG